MAEHQRDSLKERILRAGGWSIAGYATGQVLRFGTNLAMTRLLVPEMFGVMAVAQTVLFGVALFSDLGIRQNVVRSARGDDQTFLNTAWTVQILRGVLLCGITLLVSGLVFALNRAALLSPESAYASKELPAVLAALSLTVLIAGFDSTKLHTADRKLAQASLVSIDVASQLIGVVTMVVAAYLYHSIWSLVLGAIVTAVSKTTLGHTVLPGYRNRIHVEKAALHEILGLGKWITLTSILGFLVNCGDRLILGGLVDANLLGLYSIAFLIVSSIQGGLYRVIGNVAYPAIAEIVRTRPDRLASSYYRLRAPIDLAALFLVGFLVVGGKRLIELLYDSRYHDSGDVLVVLCIMLFETRYAVAGQCYIALGRVHYIAIHFALRMLALFVVTPLAFARFGFEGAVWSIAANPLVFVAVMLYWNRKLGLLDPAKELWPLLVLPVGAGLGMLFRLV